MIDGMEWRKSSYSSGRGEECVEVKLSPWRKSSYSSPEGQECVEVSISGSPEISLRDSKNPNKALLNFSLEEWTPFLLLIKKFPS